MRMRRDIWHPVMMMPLNLVRMGKRILTAKDYIFAVKPDLARKKHTAEYARSEIKKGEHYAVFERKSYSRRLAPEIPVRKKKKEEYP